MTNAQVLGFWLCPVGRTASPRRSSGKLSLPISVSHRPQSGLEVGSENLSVPKAKWWTNSETLCSVAPRSQETDSVPGMIWSNRPFTRRRASQRSQRTWRSTEFLEIFSQRLSPRREGNYNGDVRGKAKYLTSGSFYLLPMVLSPRSQNSR